MEQREGRCITGRDQQDERPMVTEAQLAALSEKARELIDAAAEILVQDNLILNRLAAIEKRLDAMQQLHRQVNTRALS